MSLGCLFRPSYSFSTPLGPISSSSSSSYSFSSSSLVFFEFWRRFFLATPLLWGQRQAECSSDARRDNPGGIFFSNDRGTRRFLSRLSVRRLLRRSPVTDRRPNPPLPMGRKAPAASATAVDGGRRSSNVAASRDCRNSQDLQDAWSVLKRQRTAIL